MAEDGARDSLASNLGPVLTAGGLRVPLHWLPFLNDHRNQFTLNLTNPPGFKQPGTTKRDRHEEEASNIFEDLHKNHIDMEAPKLQLWVRMISNGIHESTDDPPDVPMISGMPPKQPKRESEHDAVLDAAKAVAEVLTESRKKSDPSPKASTRTLNAGASPFRLADVRMKHYEQLHCLQTLPDDGILNDPERSEQKSTILDTLRSL